MPQALTATASAASLGIGSWEPSQLPSPLAAKAG